MHITVNGRTLDMKSGQSLQDLILSMNLDPAVVVAELNQSIVPGDKFASTALGDGDRLELLSFVGGG
ncbi:MAG: thiamine biosynthesis protein ThiS [Deltaproteobacteria bacterium HGW-Deltaproteobacteria-18]|jgi:sulfur carrier protein|nr:MAG: thiamine biosynthesis protein ThiS [Deltaproteobacteria bacterium HGW-Deltaproteobacteria-18]